MKKRIFAFMLALVMVLGMLPSMALTASAAETCDVCVTCGHPGNNHGEGVCMDCDEAPCDDYVACGLAPDHIGAHGASGHVHCFASEWSSNENGHWHACTAADCDITDYSITTEEGAAYADHGYWNDGKCDTCQYECQHGGQTTGTCSICGKDLGGNPALYKLLETVHGEYVQENGTTVTLTSRMEYEGAEMIIFLDFRPVGEISQDFPLTFYDIKEEGSDLVLTGISQCAAEGSVITVSVDTDGNVTITVTGFPNDPEHGDKTVLNGVYRAITKEDLLDAVENGVCVTMIDSQTEGYTAVGVDAVSKFLSDLTDIQSIQCNFNTWLVTRKDGYYIVDIRSEHFFDDNTCVNCGFVHTHSYAETWTTDEFYHWHACTAEGSEWSCRYNSESEFRSHEYGEEGDDRALCTVCEYVNEARKANLAEYDLYAEYMNRYVDETENKILYIESEYSTLAPMITISAYGDDYESYRYFEILVADCKKTVIDGGIQFTVPATDEMIPGAVITVTENADGELTAVVSGAVGDYVVFNDTYQLWHEHKYGSYGEAFYTCSICGKVSEMRKLVYAKNAELIELFGSTVFVHEKTGLCAGASFYDEPGFSVDYMDENGYKYLYYHNMVDYTVKNGVYTIEATGWAGTIEIVATAGADGKAESVVITIKDGDMNKEIEGTYLKPAYVGPALTLAENFTIQVPADTYFQRNDKTYAGEDYVASYITGTRYDADIHLYTWKNDGMTLKETAEEDAAASEDAGRIKYTTINGIPTAKYYSLDNGYYNLNVIYDLGDTYVELVFAMGKGGSEEDAEAIANTAELTIPTPAPVPDAVVNNEEKIEVPKKNEVVNITTEIKTNDLSAAVSGLDTAMILTNEEKEAGTWVWMELNEVSAEEADTKDVAKIEKVLGDDKNVGVYLNISIFKQAVGGDKQKVGELGEAVSIAIEVPENLRKEGRTFSIVYVHDGGDPVEVKAESYNNENGILTFKADKFSTYALTYTDKPVEPAPTEPVEPAPTEPVEPAPIEPNKSPATGEQTNVLVASIVFVSALAVCLFLIVTTKRYIGKYAR